MAKVRRVDGSIVSGKENKKSDDVHRVRNGKEHTYHMNPYKGPATKAQKDARALHSQINTVINPMLADPEQYKLIAQEMDQYNRSLPVGSSLKCVTPRQYAYRKVKEQLLLQKPPRLLKPTARTPIPKGITLEIKPFAKLSQADIYEILKARFVVFVLEQGIRYLDEDDIDYTATHISLRQQGKVVAYARLFNDYSDERTYEQAIHNETPPRVIRVGRMLTTERGLGFGRLLMTHLIAEARRQGADILRLHAQQQAVPFYKHFRFHTVGSVFIEADIPHILMERRLTRATRKY
ncbi:MAG: GNAT family N-acetyltransferase [Paludibacteraceae bacterium]|nr:GNAT family N-acetyltransferase [Paludibacteraceae bacterium]